MNRTEQGTERERERKQVVSRFSSEFKTYLTIVVQHYKFLNHVMKEEEESIFSRWKLDFDAICEVERFEATGFMCDCRLEMLLCNPMC